MSKEKKITDRAADPYQWRPGETATERRNRILFYWYVKDFAEKVVAIIRESVPETAMDVME